MNSNSHIVEEFFENREPTVRAVYAALLKALNSIAFPSITGIAAEGPMSPSPSPAVPSETIATVFFLIVNMYAFSGS